MAFAVNLDTTQDVGSTTEEVPVVARTPVDYESVWLDKTEVGTFKIYNNRSGNSGVTFKVESTNPNSHATLWLTTPSGITVTGSLRQVRPSNGDVYFRLLNSVKGTYTVNYQGFPAGGAGMRIMCWMYD